MILLLDSTTVSAEDFEYYLDVGRIFEDPVEDLLCFYQPIERALTVRPQANSRPSHKPIVWYENHLTRRLFASMLRRIEAYRCQPVRRGREAKPIWTTEGS